MENNIIKQAKSDIFKELYPIVSFYIKKGANAKSLKKYYRNEKRFKDILEDIKNKGINLVKDDDEYNKVVRNTLNEILDDFIAKEKDEEYKNKQIKNKEHKMKHIKEFNSYNEEFSFINALLSGGAIFFTYKFFQGLIRKKLRDLNPTPEEIDSKINDLKNKIHDIEIKQLQNLSNIIKNRWGDGDGDVELKEDIVYYIIKFNYNESLRNGIFKK